MIVPRIRIEEVDDICVLICYLIYALGCPLTKEQLIEITSLEEAVSYFDLMQALENVSGRLCTEVELNGEIAYANTPSGIKVARELGGSLPLSIREKMFEEAVRIYTRDSMKKKGTFLSVRYIKNSNGTCTVGINVTDTNTAKQKYYISIETENEQAAELIKQKVKKDPNAFARYLDDYFFK